MLKIGHRGACGYEPENTLKSFQKAIELQVDMIECDVHLSKDGRLVVIHDFRVDETTNGRGRVAEMTYDEIAELDAGDGEIVPTLDEVLDLVRGKAKLNIEVKDTAAIEPVVRLVEEKKMVKDTVLSLWFARSVQEVRKLNPGIQTAYLFWKGKSRSTQAIKHIIARVFLPLTKRILLSKVRNHQIKIVIPSKHLATKGVIYALHKAGASVWIWTVNEPNEIKKFKDLGVDGIISNYPDRI
ncbi:glycerophosphodiester phosphodiesterase [Patescibacteria group bacterium]|nr:glycerophosphodiester phosphodiesterase [Patescibacteria group bacterium]MBU1907107.1 glycerophosphodiester phosphodiesterase [Patescibacteria group bacterium]